MEVSAAAGAQMSSKVRGSNNGASGSLVDIGRTLMTSTYGNIRSGDNTCAAETLPLGFSLWR
jgi:hypothetical protein